MWRVRAKGVRGLVALRAKGVRVLMALRAKGVRVLMALGLVGLVLHTYQGGLQEDEGIRA